MIPVNSVLQVGFFPEIMQAEIDRRLKPVRHPDANTPPPSGRFEAILVRSNTTLPETLIKQIPSIRMVSTCGVGYDNLPLSYLRDHGIQASNTPGVLNDAVCELAIGMLLGLNKMHSRLPRARQIRRLVERSLSTHHDTGRQTCKHRWHGPHWPGSSKTLGAFQD